VISIELKEASDEMRPCGYVQFYRWKSPPPYGFPLYLIPILSAIQSLNTLVEKLSKIAGNSASYLCRVGALKGLMDKWIIVCQHLLVF